MAKNLEAAYFGLFPLGFALIALQELPYIIMPLVPMNTNPLMEMADKLPWLNAAEKTAGVLCVLLMLFLVRDDAKWFALKSYAEKAGFFIALAALLCYYVGWAFYFTGRQSLAVMLGILVAMPPIYYAAIGLWRGNIPLFALGFVFLGAHIANVSDLL
jgi:hypothetical protein